MRIVIIGSMLLLTALLVSCDEVPSEESQNITAILSPDGSQIAFARSFRYYLKKASVVDPGGWEETVYSETSIYIIDRSTRELTKLFELEFDEGWWYLFCDGYECPVTISWEDNLIACSVPSTIHIADIDGNDKWSVNLSMEKYGPAMQFTLSGDAQKLFYIGRYPWESDREGLYSVGLDGTGKSFIADLKKPSYYSIDDMMWDSSQGSILMVERYYGSEKPLVWQINPDGKGLRESEHGLEEYRRRRLGGWESDPPFSELEKLTRDITYAEWDVPAPDEFD